MLGLKERPDSRGLRLRPAATLHMGLPSSEGTPRFEGIETVVRQGVHGPFDYVSEGTPRFEGIETKSPEFKQPIKYFV